MKLSAEYDLAIDMICDDQVIPLNDQLRAALQRIASEVQRVLNDGATLDLGDLAMLCAAEATEHLGAAPPESRNHYVRTLFEFSKTTFF